MGPSDPFSNTPSPRPGSAPADQGASPQAALSGTRLTALVGALAGLSLGGAHVLLGFQQSLVLLAWTVVGIGVALLVQTLFSGRFDINGAIKTFLRRS